MTEPLLAVRDLVVGFPGRGGAPAVDGLSLEVGAGEIVALVGESGCGKTLSALALVRLLPPGAAMGGGCIRFAGAEVGAMRAGALNRLRGGGIGVVFQHPHLMLDPTMRVGNQVAEAVRLHGGLPRRAVRDRVLALLREVGVPDPAWCARAYAHQLSGGLAQRVAIAAALGGGPRLLIADEPTSALDVTVQAQILRLLAAERRRRGLAVLLISHDLAVVSAIADRVAVMYAGSIVEMGATRRILDAPLHPYTRALVRCALLRPGADGALFSIEGAAAVGGCPYRGRCPEAVALCGRVAPGVRGVAGGMVRCHLRGG